MGHRYRFEQVRVALAQHWGLRLLRGRGARNIDRDGRWDVSLSRTGFVVGGQLARGYGYRRFASLQRIVEVFELAAVLLRMERV